MGVNLKDAAVVVVHPHPAMGGDSSHPFVTDVATRLEALGAQVAAPDIRDPDVTAAAAAIDAVAGAHHAERRILVGYSWGSVVVSHAAPDGVAARVLVAPPTAMPLGAAVTSAPVLVLVPEHDQYGDLGATRATFDGQDGATVEMVTGADHFLWGAVERIAARVVEWLDDLD